MSGGAVFLTDHDGKVLALSVNGVHWGFDGTNVINTNPITFSTKGACEQLSFTFDLDEVDPRAIATMLNDEEALVRMDLEDDPDFDMDEYLDLKARFPENP